jgi:hypothetical protein
MKKFKNLNEKSQTFLIILIYLLVLLAIFIFILPKLNIPTYNQ